MIHHVVMWRLRDEVKRTPLSAIMGLLHKNIEMMRAEVPGLLRLELGTHRGAGPDAADLLLYSEFESWNALHGYEAHPLHHVFRALLGPLRTERRVVDYET